MTKAPAWPEPKSKRRQNRLLSTLRPRKLATFYHQSTPATAYWRCDLPAKYLPGIVHDASKLTVRLNEKTQKFSFPDLKGDTAVVQFPGDNGTAVVLMALRSQGKRIFIEVDDYYLDDKDPLWHKRSGWGSHIGQSPHTIQGHRWISMNANGVIVTTETLAEAYRKDGFCDEVFVCRNSIDPTDWPKLEKPDDGVFRIGWYASRSHDRDSAMIRSALSWASRQPGVEVINMGLDPDGWNFKRTFYGWTNDFLQLRSYLMQFDVGVAPLVGTPYTKYRSDVKALEYSMAGVMPILQNYAPYDEWRDKPFARMCSTEKDWVAAIKWAIRNQDEVRARALEAREYVLRERTFNTEIEAWRRALG